MNVPIYIRDYVFSANISIEFKDGRYRVTARNIMYTSESDHTLQQQGERSELDGLALKRNRTDFRGLFKQAASEILNHHYSNHFAIQATEQSDW